MSTPDFMPLEVGDTIETEWQAESPALLVGRWKK